MFVAVWIIARAAAAAGDAPEAAELFEARVRPVLAESCFGCHGPQKQKAGLRLDSRDALLRGSDSGPIVIMGDPERSPMVLALRQRGELKMPPRGKLPEESIEAIAQWIRLGAPWPTAPVPGINEGSAAGQDAAAGSGAKVEARSLEDPRQHHWAFQPIRDPPVPPLRSAESVLSPLDGFIIARLEQEGLSMRPPADRRTLLRRMTFDLTGLPPTMEEVEAFEADPAPDALERVIDRLLASPRYGACWGRHWLDVARYADTKGYVFEEERRFPYSYTYRDYVVRSFNEDLAYDRFIVEQIAADLLPQSQKHEAMAAMGFLTLGRRFLNNAPDIIDDRMDVVCRGLMGLTVGCARCHDHKYDPIPTADYYSLYGVFASAVEPKDPPLVGDPEPSEEYRAFQKELEGRQAEVEKFVAEKRVETLADARKRAGEYLLAAATRPRRERGADAKSQDLPVGELNPRIVGRWRDYLDETAKKHHPVLAPWHAFAELKADEFGAKAPAALAAALEPSSDPERRVNTLVVKAFSGEPPASLTQAAERYGKLFASVEAPSTEPDAARDEVRAVLFAEGSPANIPASEIERTFDRAVRGKIRELRKKVDQLKVTSPGAPPRAMSLEEGPKPFEPVIFLRGKATNTGPSVPRQFLGVLSKDRAPYEKDSGRLQVARAVASRENPLTARVIVNRVWMHHFGAGLVRTPGDFGTRAEPPTHPELLDWLASRFIEDDWSIKKLHRRILLSRAYGQASDDCDEGRRADPENKLVWRMPRRRLELEGLRDSLLAAAGALDEKAGGPGVDLLKQPYSTRRTVYGFIDRQNLPGLFRTFDFASPDVSTPARFRTTVPQQALFLMNSAFVVEQAKRLAASPEVRESKSPPEKLEALYRIVFARRPLEAEVQIGLRFLERPPADASAGSSGSLTRLEECAQVLLLSNEFAFVD